jgi:hypothetical protein
VGGDEYDPIDLLSELMAKLPDDQIRLCELIHYIGYLEGRVGMLEILQEIEEKDRHQQ